MDKLRERAEAFSNLLNIKYNIVLGKKGKRTDICLFFDKVHFHHLVGLQYLTDMPQLNRDRTKVFDNILNDTIKFEHISNSRLFESIENRFMSFLFIEQFLDNNELVFKFKHEIGKMSKMKAKYILESAIDGNTAYMCIDIDRTNNEYFGRSFFPREEIDYTLKHTKYTLLYKEKVNTITEEVIIQYDRLTPKEHLFA